MLYINYKGELDGMSLYADISESWPVEYLAFVFWGVRMVGFIKYLCRSMN